jgi:ABC-type Fe3+-siderophore transport system permease subunit
LEITMSATIRTGLWATIGLLIALGAMSLQFRMHLGEIADFAIAANAPRWLMGFAGGAFLAVAGLQLQNRFVSPLWLLGISTAGILGAVLGFLWFGSTGSWIGFLVSIALAVIVLHRLPPHSILGALACLALAGIGIYGVSLVKAEPNVARSLAFFAAGDVGHATLAMSLIAMALLFISSSFRSSSAFGPAALGIGIGLVGPIAFVAWWVPLAQSRLTRLSGTTRWMMTAFAGGVVLITVDAMQRWVIGGYGFGLNFPLALVGTPIYLWWCAGLSSRAWAKVLARLLAILLATGAVLFSRFAIQTIQQAT